VLTDFKAAGGLWAINTGRSLEHIVEGVTLFKAPVEPDFLLTHEREVWRRDENGGWHEFGDWNQICRERHTELFRQSQEIFRRVRELIVGAHDVNLIEENGTPSGLITADEAVMERVAARLDELRASVPKFHYQRNTIYLRFCHADYDKGSALGELSRLTGISRDEVFAVGDHFNDLPMLDGRYAQYVACPANAIPEVQATVRAADGHVAEAPYATGSAQALRLALTQSEKQKPAAAKSEPPV
jgi:hydroxymethylpyrimidine pyrophosphatase-like HAD family hydrolase